ncbi:MAG: TetR family transcriptional regulator [Hydrocarboniphaga sp.]|nr:TetR family transcriptional regulator [Hydrocarboniphaga sp.]
MDAVAINEITEAADVGFGSFYNHFDTREALYAAIVDVEFEKFGDALDRLVRDIEDPAEVIAISIRHTLLNAQQNPLWGRLLIREGLTPDLVSRGLGVRLMRDITRGVASGRFKAPDPIMSFIAISGGILVAISAEIQMRGGDGAAFTRHGLDQQSLPERAAAFLIHGLGISFAEAGKIARKRLPVIQGSSLP